LIAWIDKLVSLTFAVHFINAAASFLTLLADYDAYFGNDKTLIFQRIC